MKTRRMALAVILAVGASSSCNGAARAKKREEASQVLMAPPSPDEDPFFYLARPPVEAKADTKGTIGEASTGDRPPKARDMADAGAVELRAENLKLQNELELARRELAELQRRVPKQSDLAQCHACVRLCPIKGRCSDDAELVCGWGTGKSRKEAMTRATAECDGALASMRGSAYSRIEGSCPVASCL